MTTHANRPELSSSTLESTPLPSTAQVIANVIGREATIALAGKCPYGTIYVPKATLPFSHWIVLTIGPVLAQRLQRAFGGEQLWLASCHRLYVQDRNRAIKEAARHGDPIPLIATRYGLTVRHVQGILRDL